MKEGHLAIILLFIFFSIATIANLFLMPSYEEQVPFTGHGSFGNVTIGINLTGTNVTIYSPQNKTYHKGFPYTLPLNVSATFTAVTWKYYLTNESGYRKIIFFTPNTTLNASPGSNHLTVYATPGGNVWYGATVDFYVTGSNTAPTLGHIDNPILVCEGNALNYEVNATDGDGDSLVEDLNPKSPFFITKINQSGTLSWYRIFSANLTKSSIGNHQETISVNDNFNASCCVDTFVTNITVIEINNQPWMEDLGAQTIWTQGESSTFYHQMNVTDIEDGTSSDGNLTFNLTWQGGANLFDINHTTGVMNYTANPADVGVYNLTVCVTDKPLSNPSPNISYCAPETNNSRNACDVFSLTITNQNRPPEIINKTPNQSSLTQTSPSGSASITFTVVVSDPDGTIPDINWYVDGNLSKHTDMHSTDSFTYTVPCGKTETHNFKVIVTDGSLNTSTNWTVTLQGGACPSSGGGSSGYGLCKEQWACYDWQNCINLEKALSQNQINYSKYIEIKKECLEKEYDESICGYQLRKCIDLRGCKNEPPVIFPPKQTQACYYTPDPSCHDNILNCHDGKCELLIDCGGPCPPCPTCSDGKQNHNEEGIDCGGPCPNRCPIEKPKKPTLNWLWLLLILLVIVIYIIRKLTEIKEQKEIEQKLKRKKLKKQKNPKQNTNKKPTNKKQKH